MWDGNLLAHKFMNEEQADRMTDAELQSFVDRLFPHGFAGADVLAEMAPEGWEKSPLLACFHPSPEQAFKERLRVHRNIEELVRIRRTREPHNPDVAPRIHSGSEEGSPDVRQTFRGRPTSEST